MSYCRFSSDNFMCAVYVYADCYGGWTTHVAAVKSVVPPIPELPFSCVLSMGGTWDKEQRKMVYPTKWRAFVARVSSWVWLKSHQLHMWSVRVMPRRPIGLPYDGMTFNDPGPLECAERLIYLREVGYRVPQYAIDALLEETQL